MGRIRDFLHPRRANAARQARLSRLEAAADPGHSIDAGAASSRSGMGYEPAEYSRLLYEHSGRRSPGAPDHFYGSPGCMETNPEQVHFGDWRPGGITRSDPPPEPHRAAAHL